jgi:hypothetical protein
MNTQRKKGNEGGKTMKHLKKLCSLLLMVSMVVSVGTNVSAATTITVSTKKATFVQNTETENTFGYVDEVTDQYETYSTLKDDGICSKIINRFQEIPWL